MTCRAMEWKSVAREQSSSVLQRRGLALVRYRKARSNMHPLVADSYIVRLDFTETLLGSQPTDNIAINYWRNKKTRTLAAKLKKEGMAQKEAQATAAERVNESLELADEDNPLHVTGFASDSRGLHLWDNQLKGAIKGVSKILSLKVAGKAKGEVSAITDIQNKLWVFSPTGKRRIHLMRDEQLITEPDRLLVRPLRAQTAQGMRTSIATSEALDPPLSVTFRIDLLRGHRIKREHLETIFSFGCFEGLGQWRSSGLGRYEVASLEAISVREQVEA